MPAGNASWALQVGNLGQGERLYAGGGFGVPFGGLAQYDGEQWLPIGTGVGINGPFSPYVADLTIFDDGTGPALYAVGRFDSIDGANTILAAKFDGTSWSRIGNGLTRSDSLKYLNAVTVFDDGTGPALYVAGTTFGIVGVSGQTNAAKWNGTAWTPVGGVIGTGRVTDLVAWDNGDGAKLYFSGTAFPGINNFGRLEGNTWVSVDGSLRDSSTPGQTTSGNWPSSFGLGVHDGDLYIGGSFITIGPVAARGIAALTRCDSPDCPGDWDGSGGVDGDDITAFFADWQAGNADIDGSGGTDGDDITFFFVRWQAGC